MTDRPAPAATSDDAAAARPDPAPAGGVDARVLEAATPTGQHPLLGLLYLVFVGLPLLFAREVGAAALLASALAVLAFVPLWLAFVRERTSPRARAALVVASALLGHALIPLNPGGITFTIYGMTLAAAVWPVRRVVGWSLLAWAAMVLQLALLYADRRVAMGIGLMVALIGGLAVGGILAGRTRARRDAELRLSQDEVRRLASLAERERIGRDLHDVLGHTLSLVVLEAQLARRLLARDPAGAEARLAELEGVARDALAQVREAVTGIRAAGLEAELAAARLALLASDVQLDHRLPATALPAEVEAAFSLALREAVTNILRHAGARRVEVELRTTGEPGRGEWVLEVRDDGRGGALERAAGHGLRGMGERVAALGGRLEVDSPAGEGTRLRLVVPRARALAAAPAVPGDAPAEDAPAGRALASGALR